MSSGLWASGSAILRIAGGPRQVLHEPVVQGRITDYAHKVKNFKNSLSCELFTKNCLSTPLAQCNLNLIQE